MATNLNKRIDSVDLNTRYLLKYQSVNIDSLDTKITRFEKLFKDVFNKNDEQTPEQAKALELKDKKKKELLSALSLQTKDSAAIDIENIQEIALDWMELADTDGNGLLDLEEFTAFFSQVEGVSISQEEIKQMFKDFDNNGNGALSVEEFARAIYKVVMSANSEAGGEDDDEYYLEDQEAAEQP